MKGTVTNFKTSDYKHEIKKRAQMEKTIEEYTIRLQDGKVFLDGAEISDPDAKIISKFIRNYSGGVGHEKPTADADPKQMDFLINTAAYYKDIIKTKSQNSSYGICNKCKTQKHLVTDEGHCPACRHVHNQESLDVDTGGVNDSSNMTPSSNGDMQI